MLSNPLDSWFQAHPLWSWIFSHPTWALVSLGGVLLLGWGFFRAIARLLEQVLVSLLRTPVAFLGWIFRQIFRQSEAKPSAAGSTPQAKLQGQLARLEKLQAEQTVLTQEIKTLLASLPRSGDRSAN
jgi:hypothetical protein